MTLKYNFGDEIFEYKADVDTDILRNVIAEYAGVNKANAGVSKLIDFIVYDLDIRTELEESLEEGITEKYYNKAARYYAEQKECAQAQADNVTQIIHSWHKGG